MDRYSLLRQGEIPQYDKIVDQRLFKYCGIYPVDLLSGTDAVIFGGAVRDSIADQPINDIDILALSNGALLLADRLTRIYGYMLFKELISFENAQIYASTGLINEPWTFIKGNSIIQIIRPKVTLDSPTPEEALKSLLTQVDISACGVVYDPQQCPEVYETINGAIADCSSKVFRILKDNNLYTRRTEVRADKLVGRGWKNITEPRVVHEIESKDNLDDESFTKFLDEVANQDVQR